MKLTSQLLKEHYGKLDVDVKVQNNIIREALILNGTKEPLLFAITIFYDLNSPIVLEIWKEIRNNLLLGETILSKGYAIIKTDIAFFNAKCPNWLLNYIGRQKSVHNVFTYEFMIQISENKIHKIGRIFEILVDDHVTGYLKDDIVNEIDAEELTKLLKNAYQKAKIEKEHIEFY